LRYSWIQGGKPPQSDCAVSASVEPPCRASLFCGVRCAFGCPGPAEDYNQRSSAISRCEPKRGASWIEPGRASNWMVRNVSRCQLTVELSRAAAHARHPQQFSKWLPNRSRLHRGDSRVGSSERLGCQMKKEDVARQGRAWFDMKTTSGKSADGPLSSVDAMPFKCLSKNAR
jgi:hypothetical protein